MELQKGRPETGSQRLQKEIRVYDLLDSLNITYDRIDHEPLMTMDACAQAELDLKAPICKNLLLCNRQCTTFYLLMMPGTKPFKTSILSKELGCSRLSFAAPEYMEEFLDITPGSLSVMGLMNDKDRHVNLVIDEEILQNEWIGLHPCINTSCLRLHTRDLLDTVIPAMKHAITLVHLP